MLTAQRLREVLHYCPDTGNFTWIMSTRKGWVGKVAGSPASGGYIQTLVDCHPYRNARLAFLWMTGQWPKQEVDHIDGNRTNNSWNNLRDVSRSVGCRNRATDKAVSGIAGVSPYKDRWVMQLTRDDGARMNEYFTDFFEACCRRKSLELKHGYTGRPY